MNEMEGRVEICNFNQWGTVCDRNWEAPEAAVACRQAGFSDQGWLETTCQCLYFIHPFSLCVLPLWAWKVMDYI